MMRAACKIVVLAVTKQQLCCSSKDDLVMTTFKALRTLIKKQRRCKHYNAKPAIHGKQTTLSKPISKASRLCQQQPRSQS
eukprot:5042730-Amphidinium_carterae.1